MKRTTNFKKMLFQVLMLTFIGAMAQDQMDPKKIGAERIDDYLELLKLGYSDAEIFQDLGNASLLSDKFEAASFWYEKLIGLGDDQLTALYEERYRYSLAKSQHQAIPTKDWKSTITNEYVAKNSNSVAQRPNQGNNEQLGSNAGLPGYIPSMSLTEDGKVAYFSKAVYKKPTTGIFSKRELVHEIYRAEKVEGRWKNIQKVIVCPEHFSAKHPTISGDGKRLFFASNMPGSYGKFDIYVADLDAKGTFGLAKNLGSKVNTKKDELYPSLHNHTLLFFASEGRKGYGGLDLYATQVQQESLTLAVNLGDHINSAKDDYAIQLDTQQGRGYVVSNRGADRIVDQFAVQFGGKRKLAAEREEKLANILNNPASLNYSNTVYEDDNP